MFDRAWALFKTAIFTIVVPGTVAVYLPDALTRGAVFAPPSGLAGYAALIPIAFGVVLYARCAWDFSVVGLGTPAPIDPPKALVNSRALPVDAQPDIRRRHVGSRRRVDPDGVVRPRLARAGGVRRIQRLRDAVRGADAPGKVRRRVHELLRSSPEVALKEGLMDTMKPDVQSTRLYLMLSVVGVVLLVIGWYEWLVR